MKKTTWSLMLAAALAASLAGCSTAETETEAAGTTAAGSTAAAGDTEAAGTEEAAEEIHLTVAWWGNQVRNDRTQQVLDLYTQANPNVTFDSQPAQFSDYFTKLATAAAGNALPDVLQMNYTSYLEEYVDNGLLEDLK